MKNAKNFTMTFKVCFMALLLFLCFALIDYSSYRAQNKARAERKEQKMIQILRTISDAAEENEGKIDFDKITVRDDWDKFCIVMAYLNPEKELKEFINEPSSIDQFLPDYNDDGFGLGVLFVKDKEIIDSMHLSRYRLSVPASSDVGEFVKSISYVKSNGRLGFPLLNPNFENRDEAPRTNCYTRKYTIKMHKDWEYAIAKDEG